MITYKWLFGALTESRKTVWFNIYANTKQRAILKGLNKALAETGEKAINYYCLLETMVRIKEVE